MLAVHIVSPHLFASAVRYASAPLTRTDAFFPPFEQSQQPAATRTQSASTAHERATPLASGSAAGAEAFGATPDDAGSGGRRPAAPSSPFLHDSAHESAAITRIAIHRSSISAWFYPRADHPATLPPCAA
jgi:hypothetical protein